MNNPFIDTVLYTTVMLHPGQLNNNIYSNLKQNLIKTLERRCYKNYGYISKIYEILERDNGTVNNFISFKIKFSCRLCHPLETTQIICRVGQVSDVFISLLRDPIHVIVTTEEDRYNKNKFFKDPQTKKFIIKETGEALEVGSFVKTTILSKGFTDKSKKIRALGTLDDVATEEEIKTFYNEEYAPVDHITEYEDYTNKRSFAKKDEEDAKPKEDIDTSSINLSTTTESSKVEKKKKVSKK